MYLALLLICLASCKNIEHHEEFIKLESLVDKSKILQYDNVVLFGTMSCQGCVEEQIVNFINNDNDTLFNQTLFVLDTTTKNGNTYYQYFKNYEHRDNRDIDKMFRRNVNLTVFKIDQKKQEVRYHIINNIDSSLTYYLTNL